MVRSALNARTSSAIGSRRDRTMPRWARRTLSVAVVVVIGGSIVALPAGASSRAAAVAQARKALIVRSDFPSGWTTSPSNNSNSTLGDAQVAACLGVPVSVINYNPPTAYSPEFNFASTDSQVDDNVSVYPNEKTLTEQYSLWSSARTPACFAKAFNTPSLKRTFEKQIGSGAILGTATAKWLPKPNVGDQVTALELQIPFTSDGKSYLISETLVTMVSKLVAAQLGFTTIDDLAVPTSLVSHLESVTAQRLG
jgi:hypothetical protein